MEIATKKFFKLSLVLSVYLGLTFSFSCALTHHSETTAHSATLDSVAELAQGSEACCGTSLSKSDHSLKETFLTIPKNHTQDLYDMLAVGLIVVAAMIGRRLFEQIKQQLAYFVRLYTRQRLEILALNYLRLAFSRGILNPQKYNLAFSR